MSSAKLAVKVGGICFALGFATELLLEKVGYNAYLEKKAEEKLQQAIAEEELTRMRVKQRKENLH